MPGQENESPAAQQKTEGRLKIFLTRTRVSTHITNMPGQENKGPPAQQKTEGQPKMTYCVYNIATWNAIELNQQMKDIEVFINTQKIDIPLVSDIHFTEQNYINISTYRYQLSGWESPCMFSNNHKKRQIITNLPSMIRIIFRQRI
jgi:hypothetical protein